jgi:hypothetical protein
MLWAAGVGCLFKIDQFFKSPKATPRRGRSGHRKSRTAALRVRG